MLIFTGEFLWISFAASVVSTLREHPLWDEETETWVMGVRTKVQTRDCLIQKFKLAIKQGFFPLREPRCA